MPLVRATVASLTLIQTPTPSPPSPQFLDWGIAIAVLVFILKTGLEFFKTKDEAEAALTGSLIADLRANAQASQQKQAELLQDVKGTQDGIGKSLAKAEVVLNQLAISDQAAKRDAAMLTVEIRQVMESLTILGERVSALHARMDAAGTPSTHLH